MRSHELDLLHFPFYLYRTAFAIRHELNRELTREFNDALNADYWFILSALWEEDNLLHGSLALRVSRDKASLSRTLDAMEQVGLVQRVVDASDRRASRVCLTQKSIELRDKVNDIALKTASGMLSGLNPIEVKELVRMLNQVFEKHRG